jgi:hypothetical protein
MVPSVQIGIVDSLERYLVYGLAWWMDWKRAQSTAWFVESLARISYGSILKSRHPMTIGVTMCLVWNSLLTN